MAMQHILYAKIASALLALMVQAVPARAIATTAEPRVKTEMLVSTAWLSEHLKDPGLVVLCVAGSPGFYSEGHIPGSRFINLDQITVKRGDIPNELAPVEQLQKVFHDAGVTNTSRVVIYGDRYNLLGARAYYTLDYLGLSEHAALLDGGLSKWKNELRPLTSDIPAAKPGALTVKVNP